MAKPPAHRRLFQLSLFLMAVSLAGMAYLHWPRGQTGLPVISVDLAGHIYQAEIATTPEQQEMGLMHRTHMDDDKGMLFIYSKAADMSFWMKNTKIPLDILFFDEAGALVAQHRNVPPCTADPCATYPSGKPARYVLELNGGQARAINLAEGAPLKRAALPNK